MPRQYAEENLNQAATTLLVVEGHLRAMPGRVDDENATPLMGQDSLANLRTKDVRVVIEAAQDDVALSPNIKTQ